MIKWSEKIIRLALFRYCKQKRNAGLLAHAVNDNDFAAVINDKVYEFEIKVSLADLKKETKSQTKLSKHQRYGNPEHTLSRSRFSRRRFCPHFFYFAVPIEMVEKTVEFCEEHFPAYGVISVTQQPGWDWSSGKTDGSTLVVVKQVEKRARPLRPKGDTDYEIETISKRMGVLVIEYYREQMKGEGVKFAFFNEQ